MLNRRPPQARLWIPGKCLSASLLLGLLLTVTPQVLSAPVVAQTPAQTSDVQAVQEQLSGQWQTQDSSDRSGQPLRIIFTEEGMFFMLLPFDPETTVALPLEYSIDSSVQPMHINLELPGAETVMTIFELPSNNQLRLQLADTSPGQPRPTEFSASALLLEKVSESTTLPEDVQLLVDPDVSVNESRQEEAKINLGVLNRAQQAYYLEFSEFATQLEDLRSGVEAETDNYRYEIVPPDDEAQSVMMTATAKRPEQKSYTGAVFTVQSNDEALTVAGICETEVPSSTPPAMPALSSSSSPEIQCPAGSRLVQ